MHTITDLAIIGIEAELDRLRKRIEVLENPAPVPLPPPQPPVAQDIREWSPYMDRSEKFKQPEPFTSPYKGHNERRACYLCGLTLTGGLLSYTCPQPNCPTGLGPVMCKVDNGMTDAEFQQTYNK